jgi:hypothetical protein
VGDNKMKNQLNKKLVIAAAAFIIFVALISVIYLMFNKTSDNNTPKAVSYVDPGTGDVVITVPGKTPEDTNGRDITMLGFDRLITDYGMTFEQVKVLQSKLNDYSTVNKNFVQEVSVTLSSVETTINSDTGTATLKFELTINRSIKISAKVSYFGIDNPSLVLYNSNNKQIFKST